MYAELNHVFMYQAAISYKTHIGNRNRALVVIDAVVLKVDTEISHISVHSNLSNKGQL